MMVEPNQKVNLDKRAITLAERFLKMAEERGEEVVIKTIPFTNDDVPKYLENLRRFEEASRKVNINICGRAYVERDYVA